MTTERLYSDSPRQEHPFDPVDHDDPTEQLAALIRRLRLGERVRLPDNTLVVSRTIRVGPNEQRRFSVVPPVDKSTPSERHRILALGHNAHKTAALAAAAALENR